jgi:hypothetical protein
MNWIGRDCTLAFGAAPAGDVGGVEIEKESGAENLSPCPRSCIVTEVENYYNKKNWSSSNNDGQTKLNEKNKGSGLNRIPHLCWY